jgi:hypothetical protein
MNGCDCMGKVTLFEELMDNIEEEEDPVIKVNKEITPELRRFINESKALQKKGLDMSTIDHLKSLSARNFI